MTVSPSALERAFALAKSGSCPTVAAIKSRLAREGFSADQVTGPKLAKQLRAEIKAARCDASDAECPYPYVYRWDRQGRKGQSCKVTARGALNSVRVEFEDRYVMITSRNALKKSTRNA